MTWLPSNCSLGYTESVRSFRNTMSEFQELNDIGRSTAHKWYNRGCRTLDDIKAGKGGVKLSHAQQIGLDFYDGASKVTLDCVSPVSRPDSQISTRACHDKRRKTSST